MFYAFGLCSIHLYCAPFWSMFVPYLGAIVPFVCFWSVLQVLLFFSDALFYPCDFVLSMWFCSIQVLLFHPGALFSIQVWIAARRRRYSSRLCWGIMTSMFVRWNTPRTWWLWVWTLPSYNYSIWYAISFVLDHDCLVIMSLKCEIKTKCLVGHIS